MINESVWCVSTELFATMFWEVDWIDRQIVRWIDACYCWEFLFQKLSAVAGPQVWGSPTGLARWNESIVKRSESFLDEVSYIGLACYLVCLPFVFLSAYVWEFCKEMIIPHSYWHICCGLQHGLSINDAQSSFTMIYSIEIGNCYTRSITSMDCI